MKRSLKSALAESLQDEEQSVDDRFAKAELVLGAGKRKTASKATSVDTPVPIEQVRVIRDTFSFPESDYGLISQLRERCLAKGHNASKSEVVRSGLKALMQLSDTQLLSAVRVVEKLKPGRVKQAV